MAQPFNYSLGTPSPMEAGQKAYQTELQGLNVQAQMQAAQAQAIAAQQRAQQEALRQQQWQEVTARLLSPNAKATDYQRAMFLGNKEQAEIIAAMFKQQQEEQNRASVSKIAPVVYALHSGKPEAAIARLEQQKQAYSDNPAAVQEIDGQIEIIKADPQAAQLQLGGTLSLIPGGDKVLENLLKLTQERRTATQSVVEQRKLDAEARIKEVEAKLAPDVMGAQLGLTRAQIGQAQAAIRASNAAAAQSGAAARRAEAEAAQMGSGIIPIDKRPEAETKFRAEYNNQTKPYQEVKASYARVLSAEDSAVGDLALVYGYMKMLDPGSVVREGEFATAENSGGIPEKIRNIYNKAVNGERLQQSQRSAFKGQAQQLYKSAQQQEQQVRAGIGRIAKGYGLNTDNIFYTATDIEPTAPQQPQPQQPARAQAQFTTRQPVAQAQPSPSANRINALLDKYGTK